MLSVRYGGKQGTEPARADHDDLVASVGRSVGKKVAVAVGIVALSVATTGVLPKNAYAANRSPVATGCFYQKRGGAPWSRTVQFWENTAQGLAYRNQQEGDINGCTSWHVPPGTQFELIVDYRQGPNPWKGRSGVWTMGQSDAHIGWHPVYG